MIQSFSRDGCIVGSSPAPVIPAQAGTQPAHDSLGSRLRGNDGWRRNDVWRGEEVIHRSPEDIMDEIASLDAESAEVLLTIRGLL